MRDLISNVGGTDYAAFALTGVIALLFTLVYLWWNEQSSGKLSFPGLSSKDENLGNLSMITKDGGLHKFLLDHHRKFGPIFSFYWGKELAVSLGAPNLWKDIQMLFDRPVNQFALFKPFIGESSIQYMNSPHGRKHRQIHDRNYSFTAISGYFHEYVKVGDEIVEKWKSVNKEEHVPLHQHMMAMALKSIIRTSFGSDYLKSNKEILDFHKGYDKCFSELERQLDGDVPDSQRLQEFEKSRSEIYDQIYTFIKHRRSIKGGVKNNFLDVLLEEENLYSNEQQIAEMVVTYIVGGFHTTGNLLTWVVYYLAMHPEIEKKVIEEVDKVILSDKDMVMADTDKLKYLRQVIDEAMRCSVLAPWAGRYSDYDIVVGGHIIPKQTPMIIALGAVLQNEKLWPEPGKFDPSRFDEDKVKSRHPLAFQPFGFAGKRKCPGYRFAYYESLVFLSMIYRNFKIRLVEGQNVQKVHGIITAPKEEIWIQVEQRV